MKTHEKIRLFREANHWSQEEMADQLNMSSGGYAKIERGETKLYIEKLQKIAQVFNINIQDLLDDGKDIFICIGGDNLNNINNKTDAINHNEQEIEKLNLIIQHRNETIARLESELSTLKDIIHLLKKDNDK